MSCYHGPHQAKRKKGHTVLPSLTSSRSNHHQYHQTTLLHVYHPKNKITQLPEICFFPFFASPPQKKKDLQVDSRRTWEVSKFITRNVEIARKGGVVPENLAPQPAPVAPVAPVPPPVKEESKPTGYPKTEAPPDPAPQEAETTVPSAGWIWGDFGDFGWWSMISGRWDGPVVYHNSFQRNNPPLVPCRGGVCLDLDVLLPCVAIVKAGYFTKRPPFVLAFLFGFVEVDDPSWHRLQTKGYGLVRRTMMNILLIFVEIPW